MRLVWPRALLIGLAAAVLAEVYVILPAATAVLLVAAILWVALPGIFLVRAAATGTSWTAACLLGPAIGLGISVFGMLIVWTAGVQNWLAVVIGPVLSWGVAFAFHRFGGVQFRWPSFDHRDLTAVAVALLVVPLITWAPFANVREHVPGGEAYRAYFTADFLWALSVTTEVAKGDVPPANTFLQNATLHYYWMAHFLSAVLYRNVRGWDVTAEAVVLIDGLAFGLAFVAFLYGLARLAGVSAAFAALAVVVGFCANSYEGLNRLWVLRDSGQIFEVLRNTNIDAVTRWFYDGMPVDGLQRLLLYQPHHLTGYVMGLSALWLVALADDVVDIRVALCAGLLLGLTFVFSTFTAVILSAAVGLVYAARLLARRAWSAMVICGVVGGGTASLGALMTRILGYTDPAGGLLFGFGLNPVATRRWPLMMLLSFGPLLIAGLIGMARAGWVRREGAAAGALAAAALAFYFFTDVPDMGGVWVGWRSGHQLLIAWAVAGGGALTAAWRLRATRVPIVAAVIVACVPAIPTVAIDVYNAQDITNRNQGPTFPWTLVITRGEREAFEYLKRETAIHAVVQFEPIARGATNWAAITAMGERRMAAGLPIAMIPLQKFREASEVVRQGIFQARTARDAHTMARAMNIDYLWVGDVERHHYAATVALIASSPDRFAQAFANDAVQIYRVAP